MWRRLGWMGTALSLIGVSAVVWTACTQVPADPNDLGKETGDLQGVRPTLFVGNGPPYDSGQLTPFAFPGQQVFVIPNPLLSEIDVTLNFTASADLGSSDEYASVLLNDNPVGQIFNTTGTDCANPPNEAQLTVPWQAWNSAIAQDGQIRIAMVPSNGVGSAGCLNSYIRVIVDYCGGAPCPKVNPVPGAPKLVSAVSVDNTSVLVTFNEPIYYGAEDAGNYQITTSDVNPQAGRLRVVEATLRVDQVSVLLRTESQSEVLYDLTVTAVADLAGNVIAAPDILTTPAKTSFAGTPFAGQADRSCLDDAQTEPCTTASGEPDTDCDGLSDAAEQIGYTIAVTLVNGDVRESQVTSDPFDCDTDGDGLTDALERNIGSNPRSGDTDGDQLDDAAEWNDWFTDPTNQDSDGDTLNDSLELDLGTSPTTDDTDGDQFSDDEEIITLSRNPLIGDLPRPQILVGDSRISLDVRTSYTDEMGMTVSDQETVQTTLGQSSQRSFGTSDTRSTESTYEFGQKIGVEVGWSGKDGWSAKGSFEASFGQTLANGYSSTVSRESAETATQEYQRSVASALERSENRSVTRTIEGAEIVADVSIQNLSNIAFTITNVELSVLQPDRRNANRLIPIAALRLEGADDPTNQPAFNLGPFDPARGPFIFRNAGIFPSLAEQLLREPFGLVYRVVNFDVLDEFGRNFVFSSQEINDKTAGITIDFGGGVVETYRVAVNNRFAADGTMLPITMARAFEIIGLVPDTDPTGDTAAADPNDPLIQASYGTQVTDDGVEALTRVRGVQTDFYSPVDLEKRFWAVVSSNRAVSPTTDFSAIELRARDNFLIVFTRDLDEDGLLEREEIGYGCVDDNPPDSVDTDGDSIGDFDEVRTGWSVTVLGEGVRQVFPSPASQDTDLDGLTDDQEQAFGTDPTRADTDFDGLTDNVEIFGPIEIVLFDGDADETNNPILMVPRYAGDAVIVNGFDGLCDTQAVGDDVQVIPFGDPATDGAIVVTAGPNGELDSTPGSVAGAGGDDYQRVAHAQEVVTDPLNPDTDFDGVPDGREIFAGINPNRADAGKVIDSDNDGLSDEEEDLGWVVLVDGAPINPDGTPAADPNNPPRITSDKFRADTDRDGIPDVIERAIATNPRSRDTDGDTLFDIREFDVNNSYGHYDGLALAQALDRCTDASACSYTPPAPELFVGTDPRKTDTDGDTVADNVELTRTWTVDTYADPPMAGVKGNPLEADQDQDQLNDAEEFAQLTDPNNSDTDGDSRLDGVEILRGLNPLRKDFSLSVNLNSILVIGDCDDPTCEGLELRGQFRLTRPDGTQVTIHTEDCKQEECACEVRDCCDDSKCDGESFVVNQSDSFTFREGESFTLFTNQLQDKDTFDCAETGYQSIGTPYSRQFDFSLMLAPPTAAEREVGTDSGCKVRLEYTFTYSFN